MPVPGSMIGRNTTLTYQVRKSNIAEPRAAAPVLRWWPLSSCPDEPLPPRTAPARPLVLQGLQIQIPGARLAAPCPGSAGGQTRTTPRPRQRGWDLPGLQERRWRALAQRMHPSRAPSNGIPASLGTHWKPVVCTKSKAKAAACLHTLRRHLHQWLSDQPKSSPVPGSKHHLMLCSLGFGFWLVFFQANPDKKITVRLLIICSLLRRS